MEEERGERKKREQRVGVSFEAGLCSVPGSKSEEAEQRALHKPSRAFLPLPKRSSGTPRQPISALAEVSCPDRRRCLIGPSGGHTCGLFSLPGETGRARGSNDMAGYKVGYYRPESSA